MRYLLAAFLVAYLLFAALASIAVAHDWYDPECCHNRDCAPVEKVQTVAGALYNGPPGQVDALPVMVVTTRHGTVAVPRTMKIRASKDGQMHACIQLGRLICLYVPPSM